jgi:hypothetical protein
LERLSRQACIVCGGRQGLVVRRAGRRLPGHSRAPP